MKIVSSSGMLWLHPPLRPRHCSLIRAHFWSTISSSVWWNWHHYLCRPHRLVRHVSVTACWTVKVNKCTWIMCAYVEFPSLFHRWQKQTLTVTVRWCLFTAGIQSPGDISWWQQPVHWHLCRGLRAVTAFFPSLCSSAVASTGNTTYCWFTKVR